MKGLGPEPGVSQDFLSAQLLSPPYLRHAWVPRCWNRSPEAWVSWLHSLIVCALLPPSSGPSAPEGSSAGVREVGDVYLAMVSVLGVVVWLPSEICSARDVLPG